ncbi:Serine/threonine_protein phosphatase 5 [Hexamita inflata]|uniref:Serine/threonine protein phosphatase 5 n=1 Tax=Hexamita inflata TaxID=28002 RepID=A0AA86Q892_9EUKA|nr:Serine/threonine protein phosphatase 5 [Hexamita inflata]
MNSDADQITSLKKLLKVQQAEPISNEKLVALNEQYFTPYKAQTSSITMDDLEFIKSITSQEYFDNLSAKVKVAREERNLDPIIPLSTVLRVLKLATNVLQTLPNIEQIDLKNSELQPFETAEYEEHNIQSVKMFSPTQPLQESGANPELILLGDTHGTFEVLEHVFQKYGIPSQSSPLYAFNGDYVDRGGQSIEVFITLVGFKLRYPKRVFLTRGNHECKSICASYSLLGECYLKYSDNLKQLFKAMTECFIHLPIGMSINKKILVVHGGVNTNSVWLTDTLEKLNRHREPDVFTDMSVSDPLGDFLWADPENGTEESIFNHLRMTSCLFGENGLTRFLKLNGYEMLIRSHTACPQGFEAALSDRCWTIFSVPRYADNVGAYMLFQIKDEQLTGLVQQFDVSEHSAMDKQIFCDDQLAQKFNSLTVKDITMMKSNPKELKLLFTYLVGGQIQADIGAPRECKYLNTVAEEKIELPKILQTSEGVQMLVQKLIEMLEKNEMDAMEMIGVLDIENQSDAILISGLDVTLKDFGISMPDGLFRSQVDKKDLEIVIQNAEKIAEQELKKKLARQQKKMVNKGQKAAKKFIKKDKK